MSMNIDRIKEITRGYIDQGITKLDAASSTWRTKINMDTLDMRDGTQCILGQIGSDFGYDFSDMVSYLGIYGAEAELGFDYNVMLFDDFDLEVDGITTPIKMYEILTELWKERLTA